MGNNALVLKPEHASVAMSVIAGWAATEVHLGRVFATLIGAKHPVAMSMYVAARSYEVQRDLLLAAAREVLAKRYATRIEDALVVMGRSASIRHRFAHWIWGASADPDLNALLLVEPKHFWSLAVDQIRVMRGKRPKTPDEYNQMMPHLKRDQMLVYTLKDLKDARDEIETAFTIADHLRALVQAPAALRPTLYRRLGSMPPIQTALADKKRKAHMQKAQGLRSPSGESRRRSHRPPSVS